MDVSNNYIEMCKKAVEIQKDWKPALGDCHACGCPSCLKRNADIFIIDRPIMDIFNKRDFTNVCEVYAAYANAYGGHFVDNFIECRELMIFMPRQDQLQNILEIPVASTTIGLLWHWLKDNNMTNIQCNGIYSMEQLWLAFVMKEKYNKTWNGEEWVEG